MRLLLFILIYLFANPAAAIFDVIPSDQSMKYLAQIFGGQIGNVSLGSGSAPALNAMFEKFNLIVSTVGVIVLGYISILSTINTAQEGTAMGKKWSALWTPFRSVLGMTLLVPSPASGYSMIQSFVMWVILQGIGAANAVWSIVLDQYQLGNSAVAVQKVTLSSGEDSITNLFPDVTNVDTALKSLFPAPNYSPAGETGGLWQVLSCMYAANAMANGTMLYQKTDPEYPSGDEAVTEITPAASVNMIFNHGGQIQPYLGPISSSATEASATINFGDPLATGDASSACGTLNIQVNLLSSQLAEGALPDGDYKNSQLEARQVELLGVKFAAIKNAISAVQPMYSGIINGTLGPRSMSSSNYNAEYFPLGRLSNSTPDVTGYVHAARIAYLSSLASSTQETGANDTELVNLGKSVGWSTAGQFYFMLAKIDGQAAVMSGLVNVSQGPNQDGSKIDSLFGTSTNYGNEYSARYMFEALLVQAQYYVAQDVYTLDNNSHFGGQAGGSGDLGPASAGISDLAGTMTRAWADLITGDGKDPLVSIAKFGQELLLAAEIIWIVLAIATIIISIALSICACSNPGFGGAMATIAGILMPILSFMVLIWGIGATLGVWVPMVPYVMWSTALLGWFILVIEAIVSAPILALGLISPAQDELGPAKSGLMILAGLFLRPTLMIFGFILGGRLFNVFVGYLNYGLSDTMNSIWQIAPALFASLLLPLFVYMGIVLAALNKCFALIHILPDKVMRWIGGPAEQTDMSMADQAKGTFEKGKGELQKGMAKANEKMVGKMQSNAEEASSRSAGNEGGGGDGGGGDGGGGGGGGGGPQGGGGGGSSKKGAGGPQGSGGKGGLPSGSQGGGENDGEDEGSGEKVGKKGKGSGGPKGGSQGGGKQGGGPQGGPVQGGGPQGGSQPVPQVEDDGDDGNPPPTGSGGGGRKRGGAFSGGQPPGGQKKST